MQKSWQWFRERASTKHAEAWLALLSFSESSFFLVPPDVLLIAMLAAGAQRWVYLALITTVASLAGAVFGYLLGLLLFGPVVEPLLNLYHLTEEFAYVGELYRSSTFLVVLLAAFTPIPFKVFVLAGGFFAVPFTPFLTAALMGRAARFFLVAWLARYFGPRAAELWIKHFNRITVVAVVIALILLAHYFDLFERFL